MIKKRKIKQHVGLLCDEMGGQKVVLYTLVAAVLSSLVPYGVNLFLSHTFSPKDFGEISVVMSVSSFLSTFLLLGMDQSCLKYIPQYIAEKDHSKLRGLLSFYGRFLILGCILLIPFYFACSFLIKQFQWNLWDFGLGETWEYLWITPLVALLSFFMMVLCAIKKPVESILTYYVFPSLFLMVGLELWERAVSPVTLSTAVYVYGFVLLALVIYQAIKVLKTFDPEVFHAPALGDNRVWFFTGIQLLFVVLLGWGESIVNLLFKMVGTNQDHTIATFNVVTTLADFMWISYFACRSLLDSSIAPAALQDRSKLQRLINRGNIIMFSSGVVFVLFFFHTWGDAVGPLWFHIRDSRISCVNYDCLWVSLCSCSGARQ